MQRHAEKRIDRVRLSARLLGSMRNRCRLTDGDGRGTVETGLGPFYLLNRSHRAVCSRGVHGDRAVKVVGDVHVAGAIQGNAAGAIELSPNGLDRPDVTVGAGTVDLDAPRRAKTRISITDGINVPAGIEG